MLEFHLILVFAFLLVTATLLGLTVYQRIMVKDELLVWHAPDVTTAWPVTFVGVIGLLAIYAFNTGGLVSPWVFVGYVVGGILWFTATVISSSVIVSKHGLVVGLGRRESTLPWCQVSDHFEAERGGRTVMVFLYQSDVPTPHRMEISIPDAHLARFRLLVSERLEQRRIRTSARVRGRRATS